MPLIWYGYSKTLFVRAFLEELLLKAGFSDLITLPTAELQQVTLKSLSRQPRKKKSLFIEAVK